MIITKTWHPFKTAQPAVGICLFYFDEVKRTYQPTETTRPLSSMRRRHRRALSAVFRFWSAQPGTLRNGNITPSKPSKLVMGGMSCSAHLPGLKAVIRGGLLAARPTGAVGLGLLQSPPQIEPKSRPLHSIAGNQSSSCQITIIEVRNLSYILGLVGHFFRRYSPNSIDHLQQPCPDPHFSPCKEPGRPHATIPL